MGKSVRRFRTSLRYLGRGAQRGQLGHVSSGQEDQNWAPRLAAGWGLVATYPAGAPAVCSRSLSASRAFPPVVSSVRSFIRLRTIRGRAALDRGPVRPGRGLRPAGLMQGVRRHPLPVLQHPGVPGLAVQLGHRLQRQPVPRHASAGIRYLAGSPRRSAGRRPSDLAKPRRRP